jgi:hypothetical protein
LSFMVTISFINQGISGCIRTCTGRRNHYHTISGDGD